MADNPKVHGRASVGVGLDQASSIERMVARVTRLKDALRRADGQRRADLQAELDRLQVAIGQNLEGAKALHAALGQAIAEADEDPDERE